MAKLLHIAALALGLIWLVAAIFGRLNIQDPKLELLSYVAFGGGMFELISIARKGLNWSTPKRFSAAMVILVFCIWRGGSPFVDTGQLRYAGILLMVGLVCHLASWTAVRGGREIRNLNSN